MTGSDSIGAIPLDRRSSTPRFVQIREYILSEISTGRLKPGERLPTLRRWAEDSGVAYATLSRAVSELVGSGLIETCPGRGTRVAPGRSGKRRRVGAVGVVSTVPYQDLLRLSRYYGLLMPIAHDELVAGHERVISERWSADRPLIEMFDHCRLVDGLFVLGNDPYPVRELEALESLGVPAVCLGGQIESKHVWVVRSDDSGDTRNAVLRLTQMGHERIAVWVREDDPRARGYAQGLADAGLDARPEDEITGHAEDVLRLWDMAGPRPTALVIARRHNEVGTLLDGLRRRGVRLGQDLYLCSYDDDLWNNLAPLGIPYARIVQPMQEIARAAAKVLLGRIEGTHKGPVHTLLPSRFVEVHAREGAHGPG